MHVGLDVVPHNTILSQLCYLCNGVGFVFVMVDTLIQKKAMWRSTRSMNSPRAMWVEFFWCQFYEHALIILWRPKIFEGRETQIISEYHLTSNSNTLTTMVPWNTNYQRVPFTWNSNTLKIILHLGVTLIFIVTCSHINRIKSHDNGSTMVWWQYSNHGLSLFN